MKIRFFLIILSLSVALPVVAETSIGLGAPVNNLISYNEPRSYVATGNIFLPIRIDNKFMLEPYLIYSDTEQEGSAYSTYNAESKGLGFGVYYMINLKESIYSYFGGKLSWYRSDWTLKDRDGGETKYEFKTVGIAPLVGLEYQIHEHVFLAIEAGIGHSDSKIKQSDRTQVPDQHDDRSINTFSSIMIRMMF